jgi:hypothetical protein
MDITKVTDIELMAMRTEMAEAYQRLVKQINQVDAEINKRVEEHRNVKKHNSSDNAGDSLD